MDYSNFVRNFYRKSIVGLSQFRNYSGKIVNIGESLDVPEEFLHREETECKFLPHFSLNIDAPTKYFIEFMDYYVKMMPDLGYVFANKDRINMLYNHGLELGQLEDDEKALEYIDFMIRVGIETLKNSFILEN